MKFNAIYPDLSRAIEIAILGDFKIAVYINVESGKNAIGNYSWMKEVWQPYFTNFVSSNADMYVEIYDNKDAIACSDRRPYSVQDTYSRAMAAKDNYLPDNPMQSQGAKLFLKTAASRLDYSVPVIEKVKRIACVIAKIGGYKDVSLEHLAEAIHYNSLRYDDSILYNAESMCMEFGGICIPKAYQDKGNIKEAIKYLQGRLDSSKDFFEA